MGQYLIDNNAISNFFSELFNQKGMDFMSEVFDQKPIISVITQIEALSWVSPNKKQEAIMKEFIKDSIILGLSQEVVV